MGLFSKGVYVIVDKSHQYRFSQKAQSVHINRMHDPVRAMLSTIPCEIQIQYNRENKPIYNLEPMLVERGLNETELMPLRASKKKIYDFDQRNVETLRANKVDADYRPLALNKGLLDWVGESTSERDIDVLFIGKHSPYRAKILEEINALGILVTCVSDTYGAEATALMKRTKIVLNIHRDGAVQAQEQLRIAWAIACGCLVVSEKSIRGAIPGDIVIEHDASGLPVGLMLAITKYSYEDALKRKQAYIKLSKKYLKTYWGME